MSHWNKARYQPTLVVPIDSLLKEKENSNRPISAVGTVGKWGITSFTSIRNTPYGYNQYSPQHLEQVVSPSTTPKSPTEQPVVEAPKPRKFFKSRNTTTTDTTAAAQLLSSLAAYKHQQQLMATPQHQSTSKSKKSKKSSEKKAKKKSKKNAEDAVEGNDEQEGGQAEKVEKKAKSKKKSRKSVAESTEEGVEPPGEESGNVSDNKRTKSRKKSKHVDTEAPEENDDDDDDDDAGDVVKFRTKVSTESQNPNKRYLSRNRGKVVNYNENRSRSPTPDKRISVIMKTPTAPKDAGHQKDSMSRSNSVSGIKEINVDHPPIVLRISKGTSRLISTDSEELNGAPGNSPSQHHLKPQSNPPETVTQSVGELSSTAELLAVLSDNTFVSPRPTTPPPSVDLPVILSPTTPSYVPQTPEVSATILSPVQSPSISLPPPSAPQSSTSSTQQSAVTITTDADKPYAPLKIKIKTDVIKRYERETARRNEKLKKRSPEQPSLPPPLPLETPVVEEPPAASRATRASKRHVAEKSASTPQPGTDTYELYRTLTSPTTEERYFDSQSSILGSSAASNTQQEDSRVIHSRDSSEVPSDFDASQQSSLAAAPPSDVDGTFDTEEDEQKQQQQQQQTSSGIEMTVSEKPIERKSPKRSKSRVKKLIIKSPLKETNETTALIEVAPIVQPPTEEAVEPKVVPGRRSRRQAATGINYTEPSEAILEIIQNENSADRLLSSPPVKKSRKKALVVAAPEPVQEEPLVAEPKVVEEPVVDEIAEEEIPLSKLKGRKGRKAAPVEPAVAEALAVPPVEELKSEPKGPSPRKSRRGGKQQQLPAPVEPDTPAAVITETAPEPAVEPNPEPLPVLTIKTRPIRKGRTKQPVYAEEPEEEEVIKPLVLAPIEIAEPVTTTRRTRTPRNNNTSMNNNQVKVTADEKPAQQMYEDELKLTVPKRTFVRKRKNQATQDNENIVESPTVTTTPPASLNSEQLDYANNENIDMSPNSKQMKLTTTSPLLESPQTSDNNQKEKEYKPTKLKLKKSWLKKQILQNTENTVAVASSSTSTALPTTIAVTPAIVNLSSTSNNNNSSYGSNSEPAQMVLDDLEKEPDQQQPSVKLVISKKKGTFFKSRALVDDTGNNKKRHIYKHKWDDEDKDKTLVPDPSATLKTKANQNTSVFDDFDGEGSGLTRVNKPKNDEYQAFDDDEDETTSVRCDKKAKRYYTVVRNVKKAHQIQEIGEFQEMDDDAEYILSALQTDNPMSTRCLSAIQLASKCMTPGFRMHVRAHGIVSKFFKALNDATKDQSLALCTATIMFVLSQDTLNMDLDPDSLELMLNLLESDASHKSALNDCGLSKQQLEKNKQKVRELCEEIKSNGKGVHLNLDNITAGTLAMETLLSLTSKRAGEWFKEELRELGGLEHIMKTICDCCHQITDYVVEWTDVLLDKLRKIERCLRILENVTQLNEQNQKYILQYNDGETIDTLVKLYKLCDSEIGLYPTNNIDAPKDSPGIVLRDALVPTLKVLINLTHPFNDQSLGSSIIGGKSGIIDTSLHILFETTNYIPEKSVFDLSILVLLLLINLTQHTKVNRQLIMEANAPSDFKSVYTKVPAIKELVEYFYKCEELAVLAEQNTDDLLDNPKKNTEKKMNVQEEVEETVTKILQKAGTHMEHTMTASYVCLLIGHLVIENNENKRKILTYLKDGKFTQMTSILEKYYNFLNLTANAEASIVAHVKATKNMVDYLNKCDAEGDIDEQPLPTTRQQQQLGAHSTVKAAAPVVAASASSSASNATYDRLRFGGSSSGPSTSAYGGGSHTSGGSSNSSNKQRFLIN